MLTSTTNNVNISELTEALEKSICTNHTGKMSGMMSVSTSVLLNKYCQSRSKCKGSVCSHCFASRMMKRCTSLAKKLERNTELWANDLIPTEAMPIVNACVFRFESFGDLNNETQVINYFNMCRANPFTHFALWTKNPFIIKSVLAEHQKPENLVIIFSTSELNKVYTKDDDAFFEHYPFIDKVFTVFESEEKAESLGVNINCGARNCNKCRLCYRHDTSKFVNEVLK